jgi:hypothetical protein
VSDWDALYNRFKEAQSVRSDALARAQEAERLKADFNRWTLKIVNHILVDIGKAAETYAVDFEKKTNAKVTIRAPDVNSPPNPDAPWLSYIKMRLNDTLVYVYATRGGGAQLHIHMIPDEVSWTDRNRRLCSVAGCFVVRSGEDYELHYLKGDPEGSTKDKMPLETMVFRAFELLVTVDAMRASFPPSSRWGLG